MLRLHSIETFGTHDGPGIRLVLFLQGCPLKCLYCHNPDTRDCGPAAGKAYSTEQLIAMLEKQRPYFRRGGGLTVSGGEPTLQAEGLIELFTEAKARGFHITLDTSGALRSKAIDRLYELADLVILDVKHIDDRMHRRVAGVGLANVLANAASRERLGKPLWLRYVLIPGWTDRPEDIEAWARHFAGYRSLERVEVIPYHTFGVHKYAAMGLPYELEGVQPPSREQVQAVVDIIARNIEQLPQLIAA